MNLESTQPQAENSADKQWDAMLVEYGASEERLPVVKTILARSGITKDNLRELIRLSESRMGMNRTFPRLGGSDREIDQIAADLEAEKTMYQSHYLDHN